MKHHWKDNTIRQVTQLLQLALGPLAEPRVAGLPSEKPSSAERGWPLLRLKDEKGRSTTLALVHWTETAKRPQDHQPLWILQRSTKRVREQLRRRDENFVDTSGAVRLHLPGILIDRSDLTKPELTGAPEVRNPYSDKNSLVARSLFKLGAERWIALQELAQQASLSLSSASYVVKALERSGLVTTIRTKRVVQVSLKNPEELISDWSQQYDWKRNDAITFAAPIGNPERFITRLGNSLRNYRWALTLHAGASQLAPHAVWDHVHFYVDLEKDDLLAFGKDIGWEESSEGKVTAMIPYYRRSLWQDLQSANGSPIVSTLQLILDLWHYPVRGREQAKHLLDIARLSNE